MLRRRSKLLLPCQAAQNSRLTVLFVTLTLALIIVVICSRSSGINPSISLTLPNHMSKSHEFAVQLNPTMGFRNGTEILWQIPNDPKAVLFVAHGCNGRAINFWDASPNCPNCVGLPEERLIVLNALSRKFAVLVISSAGVCWTYGEERLVVRDIIKWWVEKNNLGNLPLVALGASSGGYFLSILTTNVRFKGIVLMISAGMFDAMDIPNNYPPTLFVHMLKDERRKRRIARHIGLLRKKNIAAEEIECLEFPLTPNWLSDRIPGLDQTTSAKLHELFREKGFVDSNGYMKSDGRLTPWKRFLKEKRVDFSTGMKLTQHIQEELNLAFGYHEMTSLQSDEIFRWLESHIK